jgi:glycosyltransferase involved in cell wall biosynthesis
VIEHLGGGGAEKVMLTIATGLADRGYPVGFAVCDPRGPLLEQLPDNVELLAIEDKPMWYARGCALRADPAGIGVLLGPVLLATDPSATLRYLPGLARLLRRRRPAVLCSATPFLNTEAALAWRLADVPTRLVVTEHIDLSQGHPLGRGRYRRQLPPLQHRTYANADAIVTVSKGLAAELSQRANIPLDRIETIYNPVIPKDLRDREAEEVDHPWFGPDQPPVILGIGRLGTAKDFSMLIRAFAGVRRERPARLVILGEARSEKKTAKRQQELMAEAADLGVADDVSLPGFVQNAFAYMTRASVFALSSRYEGFGNVVAESLACGCPVVSTDCPSGPAEILDNGKYGSLVPVGDDAAMADAIVRTLQSPPDRDMLRRRGAMFSVDSAVDRYEAILLGEPSQKTSSTKSSTPEH